MIIRQLRSSDGTGTLSYILADEGTREAAIIDPNISDVELIGSAVREMRVTPAYIIDTHTHADHVSAAGELKKRYGAGAAVVMHEKTKDKWKIVDEGDAFGIGDILRSNAAIEIDRYVEDGDTLALGATTLHVLFTPGHTDNHITIHAGDALFTGDLLLIGQAGRSDLPGGNAREQYESLTKKILPLPDATKIYPGHDYADNTYALLGEERRTNPFLGIQSPEEYLAFVAEFFPPIAESISGGKMTLQCGMARVAQQDEKVKNISAPELAALMKSQPNLFLLDVRESYELAAFGAIPGVRNIPTGQVTHRLEEIPNDPARPLIVICQSGSRSAEISHYLASHGYTNVHNLTGGTGGWMQRGFEVGHGEAAAKK